MAVKGTMAPKRWSHQLPRGRAFKATGERALVMEPAPNCFVREAAIVATKTSKGWASSWMYFHPIYGWISMPDNADALGWTIVPDTWSHR